MPSQGDISGGKQRPRRCVTCHRFEALRLVRPAGAPLTPHDPFAQSFAERGLQIRWMAPCRRTCICGSTIGSARSGGGESLPPYAPAAARKCAKRCQHAAHAWWRQGRRCWACHQKRMLSKCEERRGSVTAARCVGSCWKAGALSSASSLVSSAPYAACEGEHWSSAVDKSIQKDYRQLLESRRLRFRSLVRSTQTSDQRTGSPHADGQGNICPKLRTCFRRSTVRKALSPSHCTWQADTPGRFLLPLPPPCSLATCFRRTRL